ncbi:MAG: hypothetical protein ACR2OR_08615 [Hyphomicrobiales bacterium]
MVSIAYALANEDTSQKQESEQKAEKPQVSPDVSEVLHMLEALQTKGRNKKSSH